MNKIHDIAYTLTAMSKKWMYSATPIVLSSNHHFLFWWIFQVNRIKIPKQLDELVEMESESGNPVSKFFFRIKAEIHGVNICIYIYS